MNEQLPLTCGRAHRWRLESPCGAPQVPGTCRNCGATRMFWVADAEDRTQGSWKSRPWNSMVLTKDPEEKRL